MRISDWSSDVCSSDLEALGGLPRLQVHPIFDQSRLLIGEGEEIILHLRARGSRRHLGHRNLEAEAIGDDLVARLPRIDGVEHIGRLELEPRSAALRVGTECVSTCRSRWSPYH